MKTSFFCLFVLLTLAFSVSASAFSPPLMFQNDSVFEAGYDYPIREGLGKKYAPYTFFLSFCDIEKKDFDGGFLIENTKTRAFISYNFSSPSLVLTSNLKSERVQVFDGILYLPLEKTAALLSLSLEIKGSRSCVFYRLCDRSARLSFDGLLKAARAFP